MIYYLDPNLPTIWTLAALAHMFRINSNSNFNPLYTLFHIVCAQIDYHPNRLRITIDSVSAFKEH